MDGENNAKPYEQMGDLGGKPPIFGHTHIAGPGRFLFTEMCFFYSGCTILPGNPPFVAQKEFTVVS